MAEITTLDEALDDDHQIEEFGTTLEIFLQQSNCLSLPLDIDRCIDCCTYQKNNDSENIPCRFYAFRQLKKIIKTGKLVEAGYPDPYKDVDDTDLEVWLPSEFISTPSNSHIEESMKILKDAGAQFCKLVKDENEALKLNWPYDKKNRKVVWKKHVSGTREMCDVCKTTIFNYHWFCGKCGFVVCIDCFRSKLDGKQLNENKTKKKKELKNQVWLLCSNKKEHQVDQLTITQIIPGNALNRISNLMHEVCKNYNILLDCVCNQIIKTQILLENNKASSITDEYGHGLKRKYYDSDDETPTTSVTKNESFQEQWNRGLPVFFRVGSKLNTSLWNPESFARDFGDETNDFIDCVTGNIISDQKMCKFWNGFENATERLRDKEDNQMLLKLKDWPPSADFSETLPDRFHDLMECLPMKEYTHRDGMFNLASHLPECFVHPDLGPKMYTAYGQSSLKNNKIGTTNLHLDMSDAVNVMVYIGITKNCEKYDTDWYKKEALEIISEAGCDELTTRRLYHDKEVPGALWHIYDASDAAHIRDFLIKICAEKGIPPEEYIDPIHDGSFYLDKYLRKRLFNEYGVNGYSIIQFFGDAVFIPAGAPHQVKNLHNCIKIAEDFISPENVHQSFELTQQFRNLTDNHTNHEDKLQIKNIVFHAVKNSISILNHKGSLNPKI